jgi:hypothetical protein
MSFRLFEFEDKHWLPKNIREGMTDYLRFILNTGNFYEPVSPLIVQLLKETLSAQVIDLCSGGGGTVEQIQKNIEQEYQRSVPFVLTDQFPNINAYEFLEKKTAGKISYISVPVNSASVDSRFTGVRTIFSAFHHFDNSTGKQVIKNAVEAKQAIGIFDGGDKNIFIILAIIMLHPIVFILFTPFFRPFKWNRLLFTYIIPVIPLFTIWDGIVSITRLYSPQQLLSMATCIDGTGYCWKAGKLKNKYGMGITYLIGYPVVKNIPSQQLMS